MPARRNQPIAPLPETYSENGSQSRLRRVRISYCGDSIIAGKQVLAMFHHHDAHTMKVGNLDELIDNALCREESTFPALGCFGGLQSLVLLILPAILRARSQPVRRGI